MWNQGFSNDGEEWGWGGNFFSEWREPEDEWFWWFETFSKLKTAFCEYWTSIKIKINNDDKT